MTCCVLPPSSKRHSDSALLYPVPLNYLNSSVKCGAVKLSFKQGTAKENEDFGGSGVSWSWLVGVFVFVVSLFGLGWVFFGEWFVVVELFSYLCCGQCPIFIFTDL